MAVGVFEEVGVNVNVGSRVNVDVGVKVKVGDWLGVSVGVSDGSGVMVNVGVSVPCRITDNAWGRLLIKARKAIIPTTSQTITHTLHRG